LGGKRKKRSIQQRERRKKIKILKSRIFALLCFGENAEKRERGMMMIESVFYFINTRT